MTLSQMNYILEIYRCGSMNKAAQNLFISQSAISSAIRETEEELGIRIFLRSNRGIALTDDGRELVTQITPIVEQSRKITVIMGASGLQPCELSIARSAILLRQGVCGISAPFGMSPIEVS